MQFYGEGNGLEEIRIHKNYAQVLLSSSSKPWAELPEDVRPFDSNSGGGTHPHNTEIEDN